MAIKTGNLGIGIFLVLCMVYQAYGQVNCTATGAGRFAVPNDTTCKNYTYCVYNFSNRTYVSYNYVCPTTSVFNPNTAQCTAPSNYVCNVTTTNTTSICTGDGFIANPNVTDCSSYIQCVDINGTYSETVLSCPTNTYYDPATTFCDSNYNCVPPFTCTAAGRFADASDTTCQAYYFCVLDTAASAFIQYNYTCPSTSVFSPTASVCTTSYTCPTA